MAYIFTQLAADTFTQANGPLNPAVWTATDPINVGDAPLAVVSNQCRGTSIIQANGMIYTGITWPNDQWASVKMVRNQEITSLYTRVSADELSAYEFDWLDNGDGTAELDIIVFVNGADGVQIYDNPSVPWANNDVFKVASIGSTHLIFQNGVLINGPSGTVDTNLASGNVLLEISESTSLTEVRLTNFLGGLITQTGGGSAAPWLADQNSQLGDVKRHRGF